MTFIKDKPIQKLGTPFTVTTVTKGVPVELAMAVTLPEAPSTGDISRLGIVVEFVCSQPSAAGSYTARIMTIKAEFEYDGADWSLEAATIGPAGTGEAAPPSGGMWAIPTLPLTRVTVPLEFITMNNTNGFFTFKGTYRQISRIDF